MLCKWNLNFIQKELGEFTSLPPGQTGINKLKKGGPLHFRVTLDIFLKGDLISSQLRRGLMGCKTGLMGSFFLHQTLSRSHHLFKVNS